MGSLNIPPKLSNDLKSLSFMTFVEKSLLLRCKDKAVYNKKLHLRCITQMKESTPSLVTANQSQSSGLITSSFAKRQKLKKKCLSKHFHQQSVKIIISCISSYWWLPS